MTIYGTFCREACDCPVSGWLRENVGHMGNHGPLCLKTNQIRLDSVEIRVPTGADLWNPCRFPAPLKVFWDFMGESRERVECLYIVFILLTSATIATHG